MQKENFAHLWARHTGCCLSFHCYLLSFVYFCLSFACFLNKISETDYRVNNFQEGNNLFILLYEKCRNIMVYSDFRVLWAKKASTGFERDCVSMIIQHFWQHAKMPQNCIQCSFLIHTLQRAAIIVLVLIGGASYCSHSRTLMPVSESSIPGDSKRDVMWIIEVHVMILGL